MGESEKPLWGTKPKPQQFWGAKPTTLQFWDKNLLHNMWGRGKHHDFGAQKTHPNDFGAPKNTPLPMIWDHSQQGFPTRDRRGAGAPMSPPSTVLGSQHRGCATLMGGFASGKTRLTVSACWPWSARRPTPGWWAPARRRACTRWRRSNCGRCREGNGVGTGDTPAAPGTASVTPRWATLTRSGRIS